MNYFTDVEYVLLFNVIKRPEDSYIQGILCSRLEPSRFFSNKHELENYRKQYLRNNPQKICPQIAKVPNALLRNNNRLIEENFDLIILKNQIINEANPIFEFELNLHLMFQGTNINLHDYPEINCYTGFYALVELYL